MESSLKLLDVLVFVQPETAKKLKLYIRYYDQYHMLCTRAVVTEKTSFCGLEIPHSL